MLCVKNVFGPILHYFLQKNLCLPKGKKFGPTLYWVQYNTDKFRENLPDESVNLPDV